MTNLFLNKAALDSLVLPINVRSEIEKLCHQLYTVAKENLAGIILYGGVARGRYRPEKSDINLILLLYQITSTTLQALAPPLKDAWRSLQIEPFVLIPNEVHLLAQSFPTKFLEIHKHHIVLMGEDYFTALSIPRGTILNRIEQGLNNILLRMRKSYLASYPDPLAMNAMMRDLAVPLRIEFLAFLQLLEKDNPDASTTVDVLTSAARELQLDQHALETLANMRHDSSVDIDYDDLYNRTAQTISKAVRQVQNLR
ncbi:MAG: nucleotidyltransferase domain-containing protein [bacterium]